MGPAEQHGAEGTFYLQRDWRESSSSHVEHQNDLYLEASPDAKNVVLVHAHGKTNFIKNRDTDYRVDKIEISVEKLVEIIRQHGKKI